MRTYSASLPIDALTGEIKCTQVITQGSAQRGRIRKSEVKKNCLFGSASTELAFLICFRSLSSENLEIACAANNWGAYRPILAVFLNGYGPTQTQARSSFPASESKWDDSSDGRDTVLEASLTFRS